MLGPAMSISDLKQGVSIWQVDLRKTWPPGGRGWDGAEVLDTALRGLRHHPRATITGLSELFLIRQPASRENAERE